MVHPKCCCSQKEGEVWVMFQGYPPGKESIIRLGKRKIIDSKVPVNDWYTVTSFFCCMYISMNLNQNMFINIWLVVSTHLKNNSQIGNLPQTGGENKRSLKPPPCVLLYASNQYLYMSSIFPADWHPKLSEFLWAKFSLIYSKISSPWLVLKVSCPSTGLWNGQDSIKVNRTFEKKRSLFLLKASLDIYIYTTWNVEGATPMYWFIIAPY